MSQDQIRTLGSFMFPGRLDEFLQLYETDIDKPYGYSVIDAKQNTPSDEGFKSDIFTDDQRDEQYDIFTDEQGDKRFKIDAAHGGGDGEI